MALHVGLRNRRAGSQPSVGPGAVSSAEACHRHGYQHLAEKMKCQAKPASAGKARQPLAAHDASAGAPHPAAVKEYASQGPTEPAPRNDSHAATCPGILEAAEPSKSSHRGWHSPPAGPPDATPRDIRPCSGERHLGLRRLRDAEGLEELLHVHRPRAVGVQKARERQHLQHGGVTT